MSGKRPTQANDAWNVDDAAVPRSRRAARYAVPVAVAGIAAATIGLVPAFAGSGDPDLPKISAEDLVAKVAASDTEQMSGTVKVKTDLGLPSLPGMGSGGGSALFGGGDKGKGGGTADPQSKLMELLSGSHTLRVATDGPDKQRVSIIDDAAEYSLIHNGDEVWAYDSADNAAYHATAPEGTGTDGKNGDRGHRPPRGDAADATPQQLAKEVLKAADGTTSITVDGTAKVAGRDAYQLVIKPKQKESTIGAFRIAVDAENGVPLKFTLSPKSGGGPVFDAGFTSVDFAKPDAKTFEFTPPKGTEVTEQKDDSAKASERGTDVPVQPSSPRGGLPELAGLGGSGEGWATVVRVKDPEGGPASRREGKGESEAQSLMDTFGDKVSGKFGSGTVFSTRLVNALLTDDGAVYVGAVDKSALVKAANEAK
ncbi:outer membrane lipoprotein carrier protein LolA [Streptomyces sp. NPDC048639]|uniref:LolA family protein n=1 Tax=Streptomyces sp. NPDC048639 TaxID=3365581 RepID=UPI0037125643